MKTECLEIVIKEESVRIEVLGDPAAMEQLFYELIRRIDTNGTPEEHRKEYGGFFEMAKGLSNGEVNVEKFVRAFNNPLTYRSALRLYLEADCSGETPRPRMVFSTNYFKKPEDFAEIHAIFLQAIESASKCGGN